MQFRPDDRVNAFGMRQPPPGLAAAHRLPLMLAVGVAYAIAARIGFALVPPPEHIALFWPASGLAAGVLIAIGRSARLQVALGVMIATVAANLMTRSNIGATLVFALCNGLECLIVAWLVERLDKSADGFERFRGVIAFVAAATGGTAIAALPAALALQVFGISSSSLLSLWFVWFKADAVGIVTVAPLVIMFPTLWRRPLSRQEVAEGVAAVALTGIATAVSVGLKPENAAWSVVAPVTALFPLLMWLVCRTRPVFTAAAIAVYALVVTGIVVQGIGRFGDPAFPLADRVLAAQLGMLTMSLYGLTVLSILTHLGNVARALQASEERLRQGLDAGDAYVFDVDTATRLGFRVGALADQLGLATDGRLGEFSRRLHPDDNERYQRLVRALSPAARTFNSRFRLRDKDGNERVVAHHGEATFATDGRMSRFMGTCIDVTRQAEIEQALRDSEERLRQGLDAGGVYVFDFNHRTGRGHRFGALAQRMGLRADGELADYVERLHPDDKARFASLMQSLSPAEPSFAGRFRMRSVDGEFRVLAHRAEARFDAHGTIVRILGTSVDITRQAEIEQELRDSEERLRLGLEAGGVYAFDFDFANRRVYRFGGLIDRLGLPAEGVLEQYGDRLHPDDRARFEQHFKSLSPAASYFSDRFRLRTTDGGYLYVVHRAEARFDADGNLTRVVGTCADVTERQLAERALQESEERLRTALSTGQVFAFDWDVRAGTVRRSGNAAEILGLKPDRIQMDRREFAEYVHPEDRDRMARDLAELSPSSPVNNTRFRFLRPDKRIAWLEITQGGTFDADGRLVRVSGLTRDVTQRQLAEERQRRLIGELNHRVKNSLARVAVVVERSGEGRSSMEDYVQVLDGRIKSMTRTHKRLSDNKWEGVGIATLVADELEPYSTGSNTVVEGPEIVLAADATQAVSLTLHELATNAAKHGALGSSGGRVTVRWGLEAAPSRDSAPDRQAGQQTEPGEQPGQVLRLVWSEETDRPISTIPAEGFGVSTIRGLTSFELDAEVSLEFTPKGARCTIVMPAEQAFRRAPDPALDAPTHAVTDAPDLVPAAAEGAPAIKSAAVAPATP